MTAHHGRRLVSAMQAAGMTWSHLAAEADVHYHVAIGWTKAETMEPRALRLAAAALGVPVEALTAPDPVAFLPCGRRSSCLWWITATIGQVPHALGIIAPKAGRIATR